MEKVGKRKEAQGLQGGGAAFVPVAFPLSLPPPLPHTHVTAAPAKASMPDMPTAPALAASKPVSGAGGSEPVHRPMADARPPFPLPLLVCLVLGDRNGRRGRRPGRSKEMGRGGSMIDGCEG